MEEVIVKVRSDLKELEEMNGSKNEEATQMVCSFHVHKEQDETYRLFGISSFLMKKKDLTCIRFDTCYLGHYFEIYYVFLQIPKTDGNSPTIVAHTLPSCLPVRMWEEEYLTADVQVVYSLSLLHRHLLSAYR